MFDTKEHLPKNACQMIPEGTTGIAQPLDVYFFRMFKEYRRKISDWVLVNNSDLKLAQRNNTIQLMALIHH